MELQSESDHAEAEEQRAVAVCREWKQGERVQEAAEAKGSVLGMVKAHQSVQVTECEMPEALQAAAEAVEAAEAQQARVALQDPPPQLEAAGQLVSRVDGRSRRCCWKAKARTSLDWAGGRGMKGRWTSS